NNSVIAGNSGGTYPDVDGYFDDQGHNFIGDGTGGNLVNGSDGDQVGTASAPLDSELGPLQDNGGPTLTQLPLTGSPLIDAGDNTFAPATDQRYFTRIVNEVIDIGAVETGASEDDATWTGDGGDDDWSNPDNWQSGTTPDSGAVVTIPSGNTVTLSS